MTGLISAAQVVALMDDKSQTVSIIDCRNTLTDPDYGRKQYLISHLPGACHMRLEQDLSGPVIQGKTGRHPLPETDKFASLLGEFGISQTHKIVIYDDAGGAFAARCWWLLRSLGHKQTYVLNGGFNAWTDAAYAVSSHSLSKEGSKFEAKNFEPAPAITQKIDAAALSISPLDITDAREEARYNGDIEPIDPIAGHIPGATCLPFSANLTEGGYFKSTSTLKALFIAAGISKTEATICYCGSGITACHNILALVHAGYPEPVLYAGSWSHWITDKNRPIATTTQKNQ